MYTVGGEKAKLPVVLGATLGAKFFAAGLLMKIV